MKKMLIVLATFVTLIAAAMAAVASFDRGGTLVDQVLLVAISVIAVLGVHLIPALARRRVFAWVIWVGCLVGAIYGHVNFFSHSALRAGEVRAAQSAQTLGAERQIEVIRDALADIHARPLAVVTAQLAQENNLRVRSALRTEVNEGKRAETLRDDLARLEASRTTALVSTSSDPVTGAISSLTGWSSDKVMVGVGMFYALLVELLGAFLWYEVISGSGTVKVTVTEDVTIESHISNEGLSKPVTNLMTGESHAKSNVTDPVTQALTQESHKDEIEPDVLTLINAIKSGSCRGTVSGIREFLSCSQTRARELRSALVEANILISA